MSYRRAGADEQFAFDPAKKNVRSFLFPARRPWASPYKTVKEKHLKQSEALAGGL
jgi:hypothetical protein